MPETPEIQTTSSLAKPCAFEVITTGRALVAPVMVFCAPVRLIAAPAMLVDPVTGPRTAFR